MLKNNNDEWTEDRGDLYDLIQNHFAFIYSSSGVQDLDDVLSTIKSVVSDNMNVSLEMPISDSEITRAVKQLGAYKAPGEDGYPSLFFHKYWPIVRTSVCNGVRGKKIGDQRLITLKLDLNKAFDRVEWDFLIATLKKMGFGENGVTGFFHAYLCMSLNFLINKESIGSIHPSRGIHQGTKMARTCPVISHVFFAGGSLFFLKSNVHEC
nr:reverse transcriptase [Tanacetum cinerariifolium]